MKRTNRKNTRKDRPTLPEIDQTKGSVLNSLTSLQSRRSYQHAMDEYIEWYCSEPRLALNRAVVLRYRLQLEAKKLAASTINVRLAAVRRLAYEATDIGLLSPVLVAGSRRVKGVPQLGRRVGNCLSVAEGKELLLGTTAETLRQKRDAAIISFLLGCGLRRSEVVALAFGDIQKREDHWAIVDLVGKAGHVRTAPVPAWVKTAVDEMDQERPYRQWQAVPLNSKKRNRLGDGIAQNVVWYVVKGCAAQVGIKALAPNALRRTCARLCHAAGGELEQIQFLLGQLRADQPNDTLAASRIWRAR
jgi:site-specific recombinase XerD